MMIFGHSGSQRFHNEQEIITGSNQIRANALAQLVLEQRVVVRRTFRGANGRMETICVPNPAFEEVVRCGYTYPRDWIATFQGFAETLHNDPDLLYLANIQGIDLPDVDYMIEQVRGLDSGKTEFFHSRKGELFNE